MNILLETTLADEKRRQKFEFQRSSPCLEREHVSDVTDRRCHQMSVCSFVSATYKFLDFIQFPSQ
jgi:hypothetical protein